MTDASVRALMAQLLLGEDLTDQLQPLGSIVLRPHQESAVRRIRAAFDEFGGALLCDQVGMGKTFVALALAETRMDVTVVAPAVLRDMWNSAAGSANRSIDFRSTESLSRKTTELREGNATLDAAGLLIVDEAHHFRNPATRRYGVIARLAVHSRVLLLTATPVHNRLSDVVALLSIFLGSRAADLSSAEFGRLVVARSRDQAGTGIGMPAIEPPRWCNVSHDDEIAELLLALPPPVPPRDGGDGGVLIVHSLIRQWSSSDAALRQAIVRRLHRVTAITEALENGSYPSSAELSAWTSVDDCVQLAFTELVAQLNSFDDKLLAIVRRHAESLRQIRSRLGESNERDRERAGVIREIRHRHRGAGVVAFSQYADTVDELFRLLAPDGRVAELTGDGARVFGGRISRAEAIGRFAPVASGRARPARSDEVTLLLTTDLLSEGVNLQDAGVVVHLDLPWTPARIEQRLGRVARMGSPHERVYSYIMRPPATAETLVRLERILRAKMRSAGLVVDGLAELLPSAPREIARDASAAGVTEEIRSILNSWPAMPRRHDPSHIASAVISASLDGLVALCQFGGKHALLIEDERGLTDDPARILAVIRHCEGSEAPADPAEVSRAVRKLTRHFAAGSALKSASVPRSRGSILHRHALRRIARITAMARPHERARISSLAARAKTSIMGRLGAEHERRLATLTTRELTDTEWLRELNELGVTAGWVGGHSEIVAIISLQKVSDTKA